MRPLSEPLAPLAAGDAPPPLAEVTSAAKERPVSRLRRTARALMLNRSEALCLAAAFAPVFASAVWKAFVQPRPFWAFFADPETFYFHDALRLLQGHAPLDVTHPGTPVQALGVLIALLTGSTGATPEQVDRFRAAAYCLAWMLQLLAALALLRTVLARVPLSLRIATLALYFVAARSLAYETVWSPELLYFTVGALAMAALWQGLARDFSGRSGLVAGAAVGLACAVKFLFLPWLFAAAFAALVTAGPRVRGLRAVGGIAAGAALGFFAATLPAAGRWADMLAWVTHLVGHSGQYGTSAQAMPPTSTLLANLATLVTGAKGWYLCVLLAAAGTALAIRQATKADERRRLGALALFAVTAMALGHLLVIRAPSSHYLLPSAMAAVGLAAVAAHAPALQRRQSLGWAVLLLVALLLGKHLAGDARTYVERLAWADHSRTELSAAVARHAPSATRAVVVYGYGVPMPSLALRYFATDRRLLAGVEALYPGEGHLGPADRLFLPGNARAWDVMVLDPRDRRRFAPGAVVAERVGDWEVLVPAAPPRAEVTR